MDFRACLPPARTHLDDGEVLGCAHLVVPLADLPRQQSPENRLQLGIGVEIAFNAERIARPLVVAVLGVIERQLHEPAKRDRPPGADLGRDFLFERHHTGASGLSVLCGV